MLKELLFVTLFCMALGAKEYYDTESIENVHKLFEEFLFKFNKTYVATEKSKRLNIFHENLKEINDLNDKHDITEFGINFFTDILDSEMHQYTGLMPHNASEAFTDGRCELRRDPSRRDAPAALDWRTKGVVSPVKNQLTCNSCWAFTATAAVESAYAIRTGQTVDLSEQQLIDCDGGSYGCRGGWTTMALSKLVEEGGQEAESAYPYINRQGPCRFDKSKVVVRVTSCASYSLSNEQFMMQLLFENGPIGIAIDSTDFKKYRGNILTSCTSRNVDHAVTLVGYGSENGLDYWIIKNSWGSDYGERGFVRIRRGVGCCGILNNNICSVAV